MLIRLIGIKFSHLVQGSYQYNLFDDTEEQLQLLNAMDRIRKRFGKDSVLRAVGLGMRHNDFNPFNGKKQGGRE